MKFYQETQSKQKIQREGMRLGVGEDKERSCSKYDFNRADVNSLQRSINNLTEQIQGLKGVLMARKKERQRIK